MWFFASSFLIEFFPKGVMTSHIEVRQVHVEDARRVCELHRAAVANGAKANYAQEVIEAWLKRIEAAFDAEAFAARLAKRDRVWLVAEIENEIVGHCEIDYSRPKQPEITMCHCDPAFQRRGVGTKLLEEAMSKVISTIANSDDDELLFQLSASLNAVAFYKTREFSVVASKFVDLLDANGKQLQLELALMEKKVSLRSDKQQSSS